MKSKPRQAAKPRGSDSMESLSKKLVAEFRRRLTTFDPHSDEFRNIIAQFHQLGEPEEKKLRQKDKDLVNLIALFKKIVNQEFQAGNITRPVGQLFLSVADMFDHVEGILWELKGFGNEDPPTPDPDPQPPTPRPPSPPSPPPGPKPKP